MKRSAWLALALVLAASVPGLGAPAPYFALNRQTGAVSLVAGGKTLIREALPTLKSGGETRPAGRLAAVSACRVRLPGLGSGWQQRATYRGELGELTLALTRYEGKPYLTARAQFVPSRTVALQELRVLDTGESGALQFAPPAGMRILENGHDLWLDEEVRLLSGDQASNSNWNHALYQVAGRRAFVAGFLTHEHAIGMLRTRPAGEHAQWAAVSLYDPAKQLVAGQPLAGELLYLDPATGDPFAALEGFAGAEAAVLGIKPWPAEDLQAHWDSWNTRYHTDISLANMMENARFVARYLKPYGMRWFSIDDGYQRLVGDWYANARWPGGMKAFADQVHALGLKVAIWLAPFVAHVDSPVIKQHPDWALPTNGLIEVRREWRVLDTSRPQVLRYVEDLCRRYTHQWGFDCFNETDYVYCVLLGTQYAVPMTRSEAYRAGVKAIVRGSKPGTFLHGFAPAGLGAGLYHGIRTGDDTGPQWQAGERWCWGPKNQAAMAARRYYLNHRVYLLDPDAFYFPHPANVKRWEVPETISPDTSKAWATLVGLTGGMVKVGAAFVDLSPQEVAVVRKLLPPSGVSARPLDLFERQYPRLWQLPARAGGPWQVLGVFDWDEPGESGPLTLGQEVGLQPGREYVAYDFWGERAFAFRGPLRADPAPRTCTLLAIHPLLGRPRYLSTDRHLTQGALSLRCERWDPGRGILAGAMKASPGTEQTLVFFLPTAGSRAYQPAHLSLAGARRLAASTAPVPGEGGSRRGLALTVKLQVTAPEISWRLRCAATNPDPQPAGGRPMMRVILDTDLGTDIDDAYALAFLLGCPEVELVGVTTVNGATGRRANLARALLDLGGRQEVPVLAGRAGKGDPQEVSGQLDWGDRHVSRPPPQGDAVAWMVRTIMAAPGQITLLAIGPLCNVGAALQMEPRLAGKVRRLVLMAGSVRKGYHGAPPPIPEYNIKCDLPAAQAVFSAPWQPLVVPLDVTMSMVLDAPRRRTIAAAGGPLGAALAELYATWAPRDPILHDPLAAALMIRRDLGALEPLRLVVEEDGLTRETPGTPNALVCLQAPPPAFLDFFVSRVTSGGSQASRRP